MNPAISEPEEEIAAFIARAAAAREPVALEGAGTKRGLLRPVQAAHTLSLAAHAGITLEAPRELVVSARAGTPVAALQETLAAHNQHLIAEPPDLAHLFESAPAQTIGGIVATNLSGPRRIVGGAMRDHVIGLRAVNGRGQVLRAGGRVLKNVTGLDLCKLLTGSHGTLAAITEVTLKVLPRPQASASLALHGLDPHVAVAALAQALATPFGVTGAAFLPAAAAARLPLPANTTLTLLRIEEFAAGVAYRIGRLTHALARFGSASVLPQPDSEAVWAAIRDARVLHAAPTQAVWRLTLRPSRAPALLDRIVQAGGTGFLDWGGGLAWLATPATEAAQRTLIQAASDAGGEWMLVRAPETFRTAATVLPPPPPALAAIARRVKAAFDPQGILNPGRLAPGF